GQAESHADDARLPFRECLQYLENVVLQLSERIGVSMPGRWPRLEKATEFIIVIILDDFVEREWIAATCVVHSCALRRRQTDRRLGQGSLAQLIASLKRRRLAIDDRAVDNSVTV